MSTLALVLFLGGSAFAAPSIVNGEPVSVGAWPDAAAVCWGSQCGFNSVQCTGVLVAPDIVLTAGHCVQGQPPVAVMLNSSDLVDDHGEVIQVADAYEYPNSWSTYDIGVLVLEEPATTPWRPLAAGCMVDQYLVDGASAAIVGYGAINQQGTSYSSEKREAYISITDADCVSSENGCNMSVSPGGELGAGGDGTDTCYGDSGGPLYLLTDFGPFVAGTTSRSYDWVTVPCRDGGIYVRPDAVVDWIEEETGRDVAETLCPVDAGNRKPDKIPLQAPDQGSYTWALVQQPAHGTAEVDANGTLTFDAAEGYLGPDVVVVSASSEAGLQTFVLPVQVVEGTGCGCVTPVGAAPGWLGVGLGALVLGRRRRAC